MTKYIPKNNLMFSVCTLYLLVDTAVELLLPFQTLFYTLPRLACLSDDEWMHPDLFCEIDTSWKTDSDSHLMPLFNKSQTLAACEPGPWKMKATGGWRDTEEWGGIVIMIMEICKAPTLQLKALNKPSITLIMYTKIEMLSAIKMYVRKKEKANT